jgi:hypothetical protein
MDAVQGLGEQGSCRGRILPEELARHVRLGDTEIGPDGGQHLQDRRDVVHEGEVHRLDGWPEGKAAVGDHQGIGMAHPRQQREELRVEDSSVEHTSMSWPELHGLNE